LIRAIGLVSGISFDGVDAALIEIDSEKIADFGPTLYRAYAEEERAVLRRALGEVATLTDRTAWSGAIGAAEALTTRTHTETVELLLRTNGIEPGSVSVVVGFHGQTVRCMQYLPINVPHHDRRAAADAGRRGCLSPRLTR
jgi:anhydro-N-acetylmuramic acid kinase